MSKLELQGCSPKSRSIRVLLLFIACQLNLLTQVQQSEMPKKDREEISGQLQQLINDVHAIKTGLGETK